MRSNCIIAHALFTVLVLLKSQMSHAGACGVHVFLNVTNEDSIGGSRELKAYDHDETNCGSSDHTNHLDTNQQWYKVQAQRDGHQTIQVALSNEHGWDWISVNLCGSGLSTDHQCWDDGTGDSMFKANCKSNNYYWLDKEDGWRFCAIQWEEDGSYSTDENGYPIPDCSASCDSTRRRRRRLRSVQA